MVLIPVSSADEVHDLHLVALGDERRVERAALEHDAIVLDGDAPRIDLQLTEERRHRQRAGEVVRLAVEGNPQSRRPF